MIMGLIAEAKAAGLPAQRSCEVLGLSPRTVQRWKAPPATKTGQLAVLRSRSYNALTAREAANQTHSGQGPRLLAERAALKAATLAARRADVARGAQIFTLEELIANHLPDVSDYPCYSWTGPQNGSVKKATSLD